MFFSKFSTKGTVSVVIMPRTRSSSRRPSSSSDVCAESLATLGCLSSSSTGEGVSVSPQTNSTSNSQEHIPFIDNSVDDVSSFHCPYKHFEGFHNGVDGTGYAKSSIFRHIKDMQFHVADGLSICKERISIEYSIFIA